MMNRDDLRKYNFTMEFDSSDYVWGLQEAARRNLMKKGLSREKAWVLMTNAEVTLFYNQRGKRVISVRFNDFPKDSSFVPMDCPMATIDLYTVSGKGKIEYYDAPVMAFDLVGKRMLSEAYNICSLDSMIGAWEIENNIKDDIRSTHIIKLIIRNGYRHYVCLPTKRDLAKQYNDWQVW